MCGGDVLVWYCRHHRNTDRFWTQSLLRSGMVGGWGTGWWWIFTAKKQRAVCDALCRMHFGGFVRMTVLKGQCHKTFQLQCFLIWFLFHEKTEILKNCKGYSQVLWQTWVSIVSLNKDQYICVIEMYCESVLSCTHSALSKLDSTLVRTALSSFIDSVNLSLIKKSFYANQYIVESKFMLCWLRKNTLDPDTWVRMFNTLLVFIRSTQNV